MIVSEADDGQRLDRWLKKKFPGVPFGQMQKLLRTGQVRVDGKRAKGEARLSKGQEVRIPPQLALPAPEKKGVSEKDAAFIRSLVLYEDAHIIAINKPAGIATQGGSKVSRHIDGMLEGLARDGHRPHLVHRLDKDTSGVLLLARNAKVAAALGEMFKGRDIAKDYWAVTMPAPPQERGKVQSFIAKAEGRGGERVMAVDESEGKKAVTLYAVIDDLGGRLAFVAFRPLTGRTHQIRVHAAQMGCPLLGDLKYGGEEGIDGRRCGLHLHARRLVLPHPVTGKEISITAPLGPEMMKTFRAFGFDAGDEGEWFEE